MIIPPPAPCRLRRIRLEPKRDKSTEEVFSRLRSEGLSGDQLYDAVVSQVGEGKGEGGKGRGGRLLLPSSPMPQPPL